MLHVDAWRNLLIAECRMLGFRPDECFSYISQAMQRRMQQEYAAADFIIVPSTAAVHSFVTAGVSRQKVLSAPFGVDTHLFSPKAVVTRSDSTFRALFVGRLELLKGLPYVLQAWKMAGLPNAELLLVGTTLRETDPILRRYSAPGIQVINSVQRSELAGIYRSCDVLVFPSLCDGFGLVLLEAMACGLPVIATENSGGPDCIVDGITGFITKIRDAESIAHHLRWIHANRGEAAEMGRRGRIVVEGRFRWEDYAARLISCFREVTKTGGSNGPECAL
jgi:glycosyltransferase involved in cell wall biosynthesis